MGLAPLVPPYTYTYTYTSNSAASDTFPDMGRSRYRVNSKMIGSFRPGWISTPTTT